jgi:hypothetical protein
MGKQDEKDLFAINYRFQGVAEEICKTQRIVLAKRTKDRVRSIKGSGGIMCEGWDLPRGLSADWLRHIK